MNMDVPTLPITNDELQHLMRFVYGHEQMLKEFGAIKILPDESCQLSLKKRQKSFKRASISRSCIRQSSCPSVYNVEDNMRDRNESSKLCAAVPTQESFWPYLSKSKQHPYQVANLPDKSGFCEKALRHSFDIHQVPARSLLKLGGAHFTRSITPSLKYAFGPATIFSLSSAAHHLYSLDYHHEGGAHHWYVIPHTERASLKLLFDRKNMASACFDHGRVFIDPSVLDANSIRCYHIKQNPKEFVVLGPGTLAQRFTEDASWNESIVFALPSWVHDGHANMSSMSACSCRVHDHNVPKTIDLERFRKDSIQRYIDKRLKAATEGSLFLMKTI